MADIAPLKGLLYNQRLISNMAEVISPPFDVISPEEQEMYRHRHPYNMVRLILGRPNPNGSVDENWYQDAADTLRAWQRENILVRDAEPALYDYEIDYMEPPNLLRTRRGLICLVKLADFSRGTVLPHEQTYEATKSDRLRLMDACSAHLSQVFAFYADPDHRVRSQLQQGRDREQVFDFADGNGISHRMWRITRPDIISGVKALMEDVPLFIADGHHRYETALNYQALMQQNYPDKGDTASFNYVLMYLADMNQNGLSVLPTHRLFATLPQFEMASFLALASDYFETVRFPFDAGNQKQVLEKFLASQQSAGEQQAIGLYEANGGEFVLLKLRVDVDHHFWRDHLPLPLQRLDVAVLTELVLKNLLSVDDQTLNDEAKIQYSHDAREAIERVDRDRLRVAFLLNQPRIQQIQEVASSSLIMPHKSTYFYPKVIDGSVINLLDPDEDIVV
jgi:uncharacterized protein (DUF1015 family)